MDFSLVPAPRWNRVSVSTTLATNAILEGNGGDVGLTGTGWKPQSDWDFGAKRQVFIKGGHDSNGRPFNCLIAEEITSAIDEVSKDVDALAAQVFSASTPQPCSQ